MTREKLQESVGLEDTAYTRWSIETGLLEPEGEPEAFSIHGELYLLRGEEEQIIVIGTQTGWLVPDKGELFGACDDTHVELGQAAEVVLGRGGYWSSRVEKAVGEEVNFVSGLLYADQMKIQPEYRGRGYGWGFLRKFISAFGGGRLIVTRPHPINWEELSDLEVKAAVRKLTKHWEAVGFRRIGRTGFMARLPDE